jgi:hypothetical protein
MQYEHIQQANTHHCGLSPSRKQQKKEGEKNKEREEREGGGKDEKEKRKEKKKRGEGKEIENSRCGLWVQTSDLKIVYLLGPDSFTHCFDRLTSYLNSAYLNRRDC